MLTNLFTVFPTVQKGQSNVFELDVNLLLTDVQANKDSYFHNINVWRRVMVTYDTDAGGQTEHIEFNPARNPSSGNFTISSEARNVWEIQAVTIVDKDGGSIVYYRDELDTAYFDLDLSGAVQPPQPATGLFSSTLKSDSIVLSGGDLIATKTNQNGGLFKPQSVFVDNQIQLQAGDKYYCEIELTKIANSYGYVVGIIKRDATPPTNFDNPTSYPQGNLYGGLNDVQINLFTSSQTIQAFDGSNQTTSTISQTPSEGDKFGMGVNLVDGLFEVYLNGSLVGSISTSGILQAGDYIYFGAGLWSEDEFGSGTGDVATKITAPTNPPAGYTVI
jgi:hypothetical protein